MDNYKIKVKDEAESKEAQELFVQLGYSNRQSKRFGFVYTQNGQIGCDSMEHWDYYNDLCQELTLPQLRDLVVLKRNDINDATHTDEDRRAYLDSEGKYHFYIHAEHKWEYSQDVQYVGKYLKPINKPQEPALISGAEALRALADGKEVDVHESTYKNEVWFNLKETKFTPAEILAEKVRNKPYTLTFRLKPQTIKIELELPKPFEPKVGEEYFYLNSGRESGFAKKLHDGKKLDYMSTQFGAWRTEEEIKQVVEQLRKIRGTNS
ncbi:hypothetical protein [Acinetobacter baumannii]